MYALYEQEVKDANVAVEDRLGLNKLIRYGWLEEQVGES